MKEPETIFYYFTLTKADPVCEFQHSPIVSVIRDSHAIILTLADTKR